MGLEFTRLSAFSDFLWSYILVFVLIGAGLYFSVRTRFVQFRHFPEMIKTLGSSRSGAGEGISSFQAFAIGLSSRVGTGNITGVAIALTLGGPGAVFWMWMVALLGMSTAFVEATLAQVFKVPGPSGTFVGGPAYYIQRGLGSRRWGMVFAVLLLFTFGIAFSMVQANTISDVLSVTDRWTKEGVALVLIVLAAPVLFGGIKRVAKVSEIVLPVAAGIYVLIAVVIMLMNVDRWGEIFGLIFGSAFGVGQIAGGVAGGMTAAVINGAKRGLFSNEAGMGSAPNSAATATTPHPANQGFLQSLGVFVDTIIISSATAFIILASSVYTPGVTPESAGAALTVAAIADQLGAWTGPLMRGIVFVFAFSSLLGNYAYTEVNMDFIGGKKRALFWFRIAILASAAVGALVALDTVWLFADVAMGLMALVNLVAIVLLYKWASGTLRDWERQKRAGETPVFLANSPDLPAPLETDAWDSRRDAMNP